MFNLLRMDLYRVKRGRSVYVIFGILLFCSVAIFGMLWLLATQGGQKTALRIGMLSMEELGDFRALLDGTNVLGLFRQASLDGGMYNTLFGIWFMLFICTDFQSGFIKNIMALHQNQWRYVGSKLLTAGIVDLCYLLGHLAFTLLLNGLFGNMVPGAGWRETVFYLSYAWLLTMAFAALILFACVLFRNMAAGTLVAVLFGSGFLVMTLYRVCSLFHMGGWLEYTIYLSLATGPERYASARDLKVYLVGIGFLALYTAAAGFLLKKRDI